MHAVMKNSLALITHQRLFYHASHLYQSILIHGSSVHHTVRGDSK